MRLRWVVLASTLIACSRDRRDLVAVRVPLEETRFSIAGAAEGCVDPVADAKSSLGVEEGESIEVRRDFDLDGDGEPELDVVAPSA